MLCLVFAQYLMPDETLCLQKKPDAAGPQLALGLLGVCKFTCSDKSKTHVASNKYFAIKR